jgi:hypothetical protein
MRNERIGFWVGALVVAVALSLTARLGADEERGVPPPPHEPQPAIAHPLAKALLGTWTTRMSGAMTGTGSATFALGVDGTCLVQEETGLHQPKGGAPMKGAGLGVYRIAEDGKGITCWWIDNHEPAMVKVTGTLSEKGFDISGEASGGSFRIVLQQTATGFEVKS